MTRRKRDRHEMAVSPSARTAPGHSDAGDPTMSGMQEPVSPEPKALSPH